ncbi:unnamed protein product [Mycena citricolor]|uniref:DUF6593 domain-containing protein n=1 Tax=Mycena citricolor TaxID=2018698 RepID=A0AAD2H0M0_9AGAR|nr:unnamed protein product [Mycena citricolor]
MPSTRYGMPYILEDTTGSLTGSEFIDINERMHFRVRCTAKDTQHTAYMIYNSHHSSNPGRVAIPLPVAGLDFGREHALGTISYSSEGVPMRKYLVRPESKVISFGIHSGGHRVRRFLASDGQVYQWARKTHVNQEWTCTDLNGYVIASYSLKSPGEPDYTTSSGCILEIAEQSGGLAVEILASLLIMRHIVAYDLS